MTDSVKVAARILGRTPHAEPGDVARAHADAFLASDGWDRRQLIEAGAQVLGARRRWLLALVQEIVNSFVRAPIGSPRLLATSIQNTQAFSEAVERAKSRRSPLRIANRVLEPPRVSERAIAPGIGGLIDLADMLSLSIGELERFADAKQWNRVHVLGHCITTVMNARPDRVESLACWKFPRTGCGASNGPF